jgi:hypothetical protein
MNNLAVLLRKHERQTAAPVFTSEQLGPEN